MPSYESMSLKEFANQPDVIKLYAKYNNALTSAIKDAPYIRVGKVVRGEYAVLYADSRRFNEIVQIVGYASFTEMLPNPLTLMGRASLEASGIISVQQQPYLDLRGRGTLVGIIDTGVDYTKKAFQYEDGTSKIRYIWDQTIEGSSPEGFLFGSEYTGEQINQALQTDTPYHIVPSVDTQGHGTFLASVAANRHGSEYIGAAPDAELLVVKLRRVHQFFYDFYVIPESQENAFSEADVMLAIDYMIDKASELNMPLAICIGLGSNMSGHDGLTVFQEYINFVSQITGICICTAAGNESSTKSHTSGTLLFANSAYDIQIRVPENAYSFLTQIYVSSSDRMSVSVKSAAGEIVPRAMAKSGQLTITRLILERSTVRVLYHFPITESGVELISVAILNPTPGVWTLTLHGDIILDGKFNAWLPVTGFVTEGVDFLNPDPYTTIVVPGAGVGSITCGAYNDRDGSLYINSSWGPTRSMLLKPDLVAPGVEVTGIYPLGSGEMTGTSVSAAITTGASALMLQWGIVEKNDISLNTQRIKAYLIRGCSRDQNIQYPDYRWGYGKLDLYNTFRQLRNF